MRTRPRPRPALPDWAQELGGGALVRTGTVFALLPALSFTRNNVQPGRQAPGTWPRGDPAG